MNDTLMVTIRCMTYNHEPYIRQCLEGFVMQRTNFRFEAIVHDDASTDGTAAIIREYAEKYPDIIKPLYETENQYSKHDGSLRRIMNAHMRGKYIAMCEGDDYWTDPLKLQKQVDFLEANPEYSMCFHNVEVHKEYGEKVDVDLNFYDIKGGRDYTATEIITKWIIPTCSAVFRKACIFNTPVNPNFKVGDNVLFLTCVQQGKLRCIEGYMGVYRRNLNGVSVAGGSVLQARNMITHYEALKESFPFLPQKKMDDFIIARYVDLMKIHVRNKSKVFFQIQSEVISKYGMRAIIAIIKEPFCILLRKFR